MNENIALEARKLKRGAIHGSFTRDDVVHIKLGEHDKAIEILHNKSFLWAHFVLWRGGGKFISWCVTVNNSVRSSFWENVSADYLLACCGQHLLCYNKNILKFWSRLSIQKNITGLNLALAFLVWLSDFQFNLKGRIC